jgi:hypothetical protein
MKDMKSFIIGGGANRTGVYLEVIVGGGIWK